MSLVESLLGYRAFSSEREIRRSIETSKGYDSSRESPEDARSLLIFETSKQHTGSLPPEIACTSSSTTCGGQPLESRARWAEAS